MPLYKIKKTNIDKKGLGLYAAQNIKKGTKIINYIGKIILSGIFSLIVAGSTSAIAYLLDPAIKKIFIEKDENLILIIPIFIILAFFAKGLIDLHFFASSRVRPQPLHHPLFREKWQISMQGLPFLFMPIRVSKHYFLKNKFF